METRASYVIVGTFVLGMLLALFAFVIYIAKVQFDQVTQPYDIYFSGSVTGLQVGSPVRFRGVPIGSVRDIDIAPDDASLVRVKVEIDSEVKLTQDCVALLEMQGITGYVYIQILGGKKGSPPMEWADNEIPVIPSKASTIAELFDTAPQILDRINKLTLKAEKFLSDDNANNVSRVIANVADLTGTLNGEGSATLSDIRGVTARFAETAEALNRLSETLDKTAKEARGILSDNRAPIRDFTASSLYDLGLMIGDMRELTSTLARLTGQIERDPSGFLFAGPRQGVEAKR